MLRLRVVVLVALALARAACADADDVKLTLLMLNDVYQAGPTELDGRGGLARVATIRQSLMAGSPGLLFLFSGDTISPSVASTVFRGKQMIAAWNALGLDVATLGNHEFDFGPEVLRQRLAESRFQWICANVIDRKTGKPFGGLEPWTIRDVRGVKVGMFGVLTAETEHSSRPGPDVEFRDPCATAAEIVPKMRAAGAELIVAISHLTMQEDKELAGCVDIDAIVGGHDHVLVQCFAHGTPIFRTGSDARYLGKIDLKWSRTAKKVLDIDFELIPVTPRVPEDPAAARAILEYEIALSKELDQIISRTLVELDAMQAANQSRETNLGSFVADVYRSTANADVALLNGGSIRSNVVYPPGNLRKRDILSIMPFENTVCSVRISGAVLRKALEHGVSQVGQKGDGRFPQISGLRFEFDASRPVGSRVTGVWLLHWDHHEPLTDDRQLTVAINNYLARGGDGYTMLATAPPVIRTDNGTPESLALFQAMRKTGTIAPLVRGRIVRKDRP